MKRIYSIFLFLLPGFLWAQTSPKQVFLSGKVMFANNKVALINASAAGQLNYVGLMHEITPDSHGNFSMHFKLERPTYFRLGRNVLYLSPGDKIKVLLDYREPLKSRFYGTHKKENDYLRSTPFPQSGYFLEGGLNIKKTIQATIDTINVLGRARRQFLIEQNFHDPFKSQELARIKAYIIGSLIRIKTYYPSFHKISRDSLLKFDQSCKLAIVPYVRQLSKGFVNAKYLNIEGYSDAAFEMMDEGDSTSVGAIQISQWADAYNIAYDIKKAKDKTQLKDKWLQISKITNSEYREAVVDVLNRKLAFSDGDPAKNILAIDENGRTVSIEKFRGKIIVIDLWATWCEPCLMEKPHFEAIAKSYQNNDKVVFISMSLDVDQSLWKNYLKGKISSAMEYNCTDISIKAYSIIGIPRTIVIDQNFNVLTMNGPLPTEMENKNYLQELIKEEK